MGYWNPRPLASPSIMVSIKALLTISISFLQSPYVKSISFPPTMAGMFGHIIRNRPVQGNVGERRLGPPAARRVDAVDKGLDAFLHFRIGQVVRLYKRRQVGVKGGECLGACPLILHDSQEVYHLVAQHAQMLCRGGSDLSRDPAQAFLDQLL